MAREKVTFEERVQVVLDRDEGKPVESRTGATEYMRVLDNDQRIMFAPAALEAAIKDSGAKAGDLIQIDQLKHGRTTRWEVAILSDMPPAQPARQERTAAQPAQQRAAAPPARPQQAPRPSEISAEAIEMTTAFMAAIQAAGEAEAYAVQQGMRDFSLSNERITNLAITIYIQRAKAGSR
jgi:hypothetical protein